MRMLEIFSSEKTYHPVIQDASLVTSLLEQILHYMVLKGNVSVICSVFVSFLRMCYYGRSEAWLCLSMHIRCWAPYLHVSAA